MRSLYYERTLYTTTNYRGRAMNIQETYRCYLATVITAPLDAYGKHPHGSREEVLVRAKDKDEAEESARKKVQARGYWAGPCFRVLHVHPEMDREVLGTGDGNAN